MLKDKASGKKIIAFQSVSVVIILAGIFSSSFASNLLNCPNFDELDSLSQCWTHSSWGSDNITALIVPGGYGNTNCLMMLNNDPCLICEYTRQIVGSLEPGVYGLSVLYKTSPECQAMAYFRNRAEANLGKPKAQDGKGYWNDLNLYFAVRDEYSDQEWQVILYGGLPPNVHKPIYYDNVVLEKLSLAQIEEIDLRYWTKNVYVFTDGSPALQWSASKVSTYSAGSDPNIHGQYALVLKGSKTTVDSYSFTVPVKPRKKYKVSVSLKYKNRKFYNYLESIPAPPSYYTNPQSAMLKNTKGIWNGWYDVKVFGDDLGGAYKAGLLQPITRDWIYAADADRDWFSEYAYYQSGPDTKNLTIQIELSCFDGDLYVDDLTVEEVKTHIEDAMLRIPIDYEYDGMKITNSDLPSIKTNAAEFVFNNTYIRLMKDQNTLGFIMFDYNFLASLTVDTKTKGIVILKNDNVTISIGADSSMIVRLEKDGNIGVNGLINPKFYNFDAGVVFVSDYEKGILFSPIFPELNIKAMERLMRPPYENYDPNILDYHYSDDDVNTVGLKCWDNQPNFASSPWKINYHFKTGDGFVASVFPPKDFDYKKYANQRMEIPFILNLNIYPQGDYRYLLAKFRERFKILLLWMGSYNLSSPDPDCPLFYYTDSSGVPVPSRKPGAQPVKFIPNDVAGPFNVSQPQALNRLVSQAHNMGLKVILYMSPSYFYTSDVNTLLNNLNENITRYDIDGVYYDGLSPCKFMQNLELIRKTRAVLKDKYYVQHDSWTNSLIYSSDHFRVPFFDAYADLLLVGENIRKDYTGDPETWDLACPADPNAWGLLYCSKNLSNTPTVLMGTYRPVDYSDIDKGPDLTLSPQTQMNYQLKYQGIFRVWAFTNECYFDDLIYKKKLFFDSSYWWNIYDNLCLGYTKGDGMADIGESIYTAKEDCAPSKSDAVLIKSGDSLECLSKDSISQWLIDGQQLYRLHYNFDGEIATEDSDHKMNPNQFLDMLPSADSNYVNPDSNYVGPYPSEVDGRKTFYFNGSAKLFGEHDDTLRFTDGSHGAMTFSSFAVVKRDSDSAERQCIFNLNNSSQHFSYGIHGNRFYIRIRDSANTLQEYFSTFDIDRNWHTVGLLYDGTNLYMYIDGVNDKIVPINPAPFTAVDNFVIGSQGIGSPGFKGWIDDLFVTDRLLTNQQILEYHQNVGKTLTVTGARKVDCILIKNGQKYTAASSLDWAICIRGGSGEVKSGFDNFGDLLLKGTINTKSLPVASDKDEFRVQNSAGSDVAIIDSDSGNMYIKGSLYQKQTALSPSGINNFVVCDNNGNVIAYIDELGNLYLSGRLYENTDI